MDTVGTPEMHIALSVHDMITSPARHYLKSIAEGDDTFGVHAGYNLCMMGGIDDISTLCNSSNINGNLLVLMLQMDIPFLLLMQSSRYENNFQMQLLLLVML